MKVFITACILGTLGGLIIRVTFDEKQNRKEKIKKNIMLVTACIVILAIASKI